MRTYHGRMPGCQDYADLKQERITGIIFFYIVLRFRHHLFKRTACKFRCKCKIQALDLLNPLYSKKGRNIVLIGDKQWRDPERKVFMDRLNIAETTIQTYFQAFFQVLPAAG